MRPAKRKSARSIVILLMFSAIIIFFSAFVFADLARSGSVSATCTSKLCEIDHVWTLMQGKLVEKNTEAGKGSWLGENVWNVPKNTWESFDEAHPRAVVSAPAVTSSSVTPTLSSGIGAITDPLIIQDIAKNFYDRSFLEKVEEISRELNINPVHLLAIMRFESYDVSTQTPFKTGQKARASEAVGLIQFIPKTAKWLKTTTGELASMTQIEQLEYVKKYFQKQHGIRPNNFGDVAMAVIWPTAIGQEDNHVLFSAPSEDYVANRPLDVNNYGFITRANYITKVKEFSNYDFTKNSLFTISLSDITIPSKKNPGTSVSDIKSGLITLGFEVADGVDAQGTPELLDALKEFQGKAISLGFTKTIKITSMKRSGSGEGLHGDGNAADIHTTSLTADERLVLIRAAIETGFGEIYHGTDSVTNGITSEENKKFRCFWYPDHADHLHIALENKKQDEPHGWEREGCITSAPLVASN